MTRGGERQDAGRKRSMTELTIIKLRLAVERMQAQIGDSSSRRAALRELEKEGSIGILLQDMRGRYNYERYLTPQYMPKLGSDWLVDPKLRVGIVSQLSGFGPDDPL